MKEYVSKYTAEEMEECFDQVRLIKEEDSIGELKTKLAEVKDALNILTADVSTPGSVDNRIQEALKWVAK